MNAWFRMYAEFASDPKVQMLSEIDQRRFVMLLCYRCSNANETFQDSEVAFHMRVTETEWLKTKAIFLEKNLINSSNHPLAWDRRQYQSDSSTARVRKHRDAMKQPCNVSVTPQTRPDQTKTEQNKPYQRNGNGFSNGFGLEVGFVPDLETADRLRQVAPGWDQHALIKLYNDWHKGQARPRNPQAAFLGWAKNFTKGKHPN